MNSTQIQTMLAPLVGFAAAWLAQRIPFIDAATWSGFINAFFLFITTGFMGWINRGTAIISQAAALPEVQSIKLEPSASSATVAATPGNVNK